MPEWSIGPHSKCGERATVPRVRIPVFPHLHGPERQWVHWCPGLFCVALLHRHVSFFYSANIGCNSERCKFICSFNLSTPVTLRVSFGLHDFSLRFVQTEFRLRFGKTQIKFNFVESRPRSIKKNELFLYFRSLRFVFSLTLH